MTVLQDDGLPVSDAGEWALEKHDRLQRYVDIARGVRKGFINQAGATYIDLYSGPGRSRIPTGALIEGSPLVAARKAHDGGAPFNDIYIADENATTVDAAESRLGAAGFRSHKSVGKAEYIVGSIVDRLNPYGLHFAFLDPFSLDDLPFSIIERLAAVKRMDLLIHVSAQDLNRNLRRYIDDPNGPLDRLAPGWRKVVNTSEVDRNVRTGIFNHWLSLIRGLDMQPSEGIEKVSGGNNQPLYWLVFVARHELASEFWGKICNVSPQGRLF
ncbi:MAG: three-Cys-motif partner protein TcmP [Rhizomicrobium sp.]